MNKLTTFAAALTCAVSFSSAQAATLGSGAGADPIVLETSESFSEIVALGDSGFSIYSRGGPLSVPYDNGTGILQYEYASLNQFSERASNTGDLTHKVEFYGGASIGDDVVIDASSGFEWSHGVSLFDKSTGLLREPESSARVAIRLTVESYFKGDPTLVCKFIPRYGRDLCRDQFLEARYDTVSVGYGFLDIERGSLVLNGYAANPTGGITTPSMSPVPLPAGLPLLLAGLAAFGVIRRRG